MLCEKYRPQVIDDIFGIPEIVAEIKRHMGKKEGIPHMLFYGPPGTGKALTYDSDVLTPSGFVKMSEIVVGSKIIGSDGLTYSVSGVFPQPRQKIVRLLFSDNSTVDCSLDHLWETSGLYERQRGEKSVKTTSEIITSIRKDNKNNHSIQYINSPVIFDERSIPLDPYVLGIYIGDGCIGGSIRFSNPELDIMNRVEGLLPEDDVLCLIKNTTKEWFVKRKIRSHDKSETLKIILSLGFKNTTYSNFKFIPKEYLINSVSNRIKLLNGLIDSDGYVDKNSNVIFSTSSELLANDVKFLVHSLGGKATITQKQKFYSYKGEKKKGLPSFDVIIFFTNGIVPCSSVKHLKRYSPPTGKYFRKYIVGFQWLEDQECQCIYVNSPDHLFITNNFTLTHNTTISKVIANTLLKNAVAGDFYEFNASNDRGIDFIRNNITEIAKRRPLTNDYKIILMDEADNITADAQAAFRRIMEQYHSNCRFIFTCNYPGKLIEPLRSRFVKYEFSKPSYEKLLEFLKVIVKKEGIICDEKQLAKYAENAHGDFRSALNLLEGNLNTKSSEVWEGITIEKLRKLDVNSRIDLAFQGDPEMIFAKLWDLVQEERAWALLPILCDCQSKMNYSVHKTLFLAKLLQEIK